MRLLSLFSMNLVQIFVVLGFVFGSLTAQAEVDLKKQVKILNESKSIKDMSSALKKLFEKPEDQRQIDKDAKAMSKMAAKSKWKYEIKGKEIAFKVNGRVHFTFKPVDINQGEFLFNGQKFVLNPRLSYEYHKAQMSKILRKQAGLEGFFINKAYAMSSGSRQASGPGTLLGNAGPGVIASAGVAGAAVIVTKNDKNRARQCVRDKVNERGSVTDGDLPNFNSAMQAGMMKYRENLLRKHSYGLVHLNKSHFQQTRITYDRGYSAVMHGDEHSGHGYRSWRTWNGRMNALVANYSGYHGGHGYIGNKNKKLGYHYAPECAGKQGKLFSGNCYGACVNENECLGRCVGAKMKNAPGWWAMERAPAYNHCRVGWEIYRNCLQCNNPWLDHRNNCRAEIPCESCNSRTNTWEPKGCIRQPDQAENCNVTIINPPTKPYCICNNGLLMAPGKDPSIQCKKVKCLPTCTNCTPDHKPAIHVEGGSLSTNCENRNNVECRENNDDDGGDAPDATGVPIPGEEEDTAQ